MTWPVAEAGAPRGLQPDQQLVTVINRSGGARVVGDVVMFDLDAGDADTTDYVSGSENSVFTNVILPETTHLRDGWFAIVTDLRTGAGADNTEMTVCVRGRVTALIGSAASKGAALIAANGVDSLDDTAGTAGQKIIGKLLVPTTGAATAEVIFNGIEGFGASNDQV